MSFIPDPCERFPSMTSFVCEGTEQSLFRHTHSSTGPVWSALHHLMVCFCYECTSPVVCIYLPHLLAIGGGLGPYRWLIWPILLGGGFLGALFHYHIWNQMNFCSLFFTSCWNRVLKNKTINSAIPQKKSIIEDNLYWDRCQLSNTCPFKL